jgi:hypothetical protein
LFDFFVDNIVVVACLEFFSGFFAVNTVFPPFIMPPKPRREAAVAAAAPALRPPIMTPIGPNTVTSGDGNMLPAQFGSDVQVVYLGKPVPSEYRPIFLEHARLVQENAFLYREVDRLTTELQRESATRHQYERDYSRYTQELEDLRRKNELLREQNDQLREKISTLENQVVSLTSEVARFSASQKRTKALLDFSDMFVIIKKDDAELRAGVAELDAIEVDEWDLKSQSAQEKFPQIPLLVLHQLSGERHAACHTRFRSIEDIRKFLNKAQEGGPMFEDPHEEAAYRWALDRFFNVFKARLEAPARK